MNAWINWRRLHALCRKETLEIVRDPSSVLIAFVLPVVLLFIFGFGISLDTSRIRLGIVMEDSGVLANRFAEALRGSPYIDATIEYARKPMQEKLDAGQLRGIVIIPSDFSAKLQRGQTEHVVALQTDGAEPNTANFVSSYVQTIWMQWFTAYLQNRQTRSDQQIEIVPRYWFNPTTVSRNYLIPGAISVIMTIVGALLTSLVVAREWERGTMEALLSTPVTRMELLLSKVLPYYVLGIIAMTVCVLVATLLMRVPFRGSWFWLFIAGSLFLASALGLGLVLSSATRDQFNAAQSALNAAFLPAALLSGFMFEISGMPIIIQAFTYLVPARYFVSILQTLFQVGVIWPILLSNLVFLLLSGLFWLGLTVMYTRRRLDGK